MTFSGLWPAADNSAIKVSELPLGLHTAANRQEHFNKDEILVSSALNIRVREIEAEVFGRKFENALEAISRGNAYPHQGCMYRLKDGGLELGRLGALHGYSHERHDDSDGEA